MNNELRVEPGMILGQVANSDTPCRAPAPAVVNGGVFLGCQLPLNHEGRHKVTIEWAGERTAP